MGGVGNYAVVTVALVLALAPVASVAQPAAASGVGVSATLSDLHADSGTVYPGDTVSGTMVVENTGDERHTFWVDFSAENPDGVWSLGTGRHIELAPGERRVIELSWTVPESAQPGVYNAGAAIYESESKTNRLGGDEERDAFEVTHPTTESTITGFAVDGGTYQPGDTVTGTVTVENTGDTTHSFWVDFSAERPAGGWSTGAGRYLDLSPGESRTVELTWTVPDGAATGSYDGGTAVYKSANKDTKYDGASRSDAFRVDQPTTAAQITGFAVDSGTYRPGDTVTGTVTVENTGDTTHSFWVDFSAQRPAGGWSTGEGGYVDLSPGERRTIALDWTVPDEAPTGSYDGGTAVYKSANKDTKYDGASRSDAFRVDQPTTAARITSFAVDGGTHQPGETVTGTITVENTGDTTHSFWVDFSAQGPDSGWSTGQRGYLDLSPGESRTVALTWTVPDDATAGTYDGGTAVYKSDAKETKYDGASRSDAFRVDQPTTAARITSFAVDDGTYQPGETVTGTITVENTGDTTHSFWVDFSAQGPDSGWSTGEGTYVDLSPGERRTIALDWTAPDGASSGTYDAGTAIYESANKDTKYDGSRSDAFRVDQPTTAARITSFAVDGGTHQPGETVTGTITVENTGDTTHSFWVDLSAQEPADGWTTGEGGYVDLTPGESRTVELTWTVPDGATTGTYDGGTAVYKSANKDTKYDGQSRLDAFRVDRPTTAARITSFAVDGGTHQPGETVTGTITVENTGDTTHSFWVDLSAQGPEDGWTTGEGDYLELAPDERRTVELTWTVPDGATTGTYDGGTAVYKSANKDTKYDRTARPDAFQIERRTSSATITSFAVDSGTYQPGDTVTGAATIENTGDRTNTFWVNISARGSSGETTAGDGQSVALSPGERQTVDLTVTVPEEADNGSYDGVATVWVEPDRGPSRMRLDTAERTDAFEVTETATVSARITGVDVGTGEFKPGETVEAVATVENTGNSERTFFVGHSVVGPNGDEYTTTGQVGQSVTLRPGEQIVITLPWAIPETAASGEYTTVTSVWQERDPDSLRTRVAHKRTSDAFSVGTQAAITIQVSGPKDEPIAGATVSVGEHQSKETGADGTVRFDGLSDGTHAVTVSRDGYVDERFKTSVTGDQQQLREVRLARPEGTILTVEGVPEAYQPGERFEPSVTIRNTGSSEATFALEMAEPSGIEIDGSQTQRVTLSPGAETTVEFSAQLYGTDTDRVVRFELATTGGHAVDVDRQPVTFTETVLTVTVVDSSGASVEDASVSLLSNSETVKTNTAGQARFTALTPGQHVTEVRLPGVVGSETTKTIDVPAGERTETTVHITRTGSISGTVVNEQGEPLSDGVVSINGQSAFVGENGRFSFDDHQFAVGKSYTVDVTRDGESVYRQELSVTPGENDVQITVDSADSSDNWQLISNANKGSILGEVGIQMGVSGAQTLEYHIGWLGFSMVPVADAPADIRDCLLAPNDGLATNGLDCGGAAASTIGSAGTVIGIMTSPTGGGVAVAGGSFSLDTAEDISDVAKVSISVVQNVPNKVDEWAEILISKAGSRVSRVLDKVKDPDTANTLRKAVAKTKFKKAGFTADEASHLTDIVRQSNNVEADEVIKLTKKMDDPVMELRRVSKNEETGTVYALTKGEYDETANKGYGVAKIQSKHLDNSNAGPGVTRFDQQADMTESQMKTYVTKALRKGKPDPDDPQAIVWDVPKSVAEKYGFSRIRVIVSSSNNQVTTAYPKFAS
ncbi:carboxypeptidase regulatory-like domain-containing protein [Halomicroarcula pellucida]|uniref:Alpha-galactosidase NEW3 domain-containing protein n=2 Tax=Haloarcula pellucida TaxID=1427151 RepID=A0A830GNY5_9EURY|nr:NEW3 domain-containing protein [Halomicroarcula pellucida]MBX0349710.1 carboxypeptidase regulatory-like domain-containing protein [Halomicroarcula pellucida]GGN93938.1 hypothetical protein GCM10009030_19780 [Halomicroarcula pellucida]